MDDQSITLCCTYCSAPLLVVPQAGRIICSGCAEAFPMRCGMPDFSHDELFYWGELDRAAMQRILESPLPTDDALVAELLTHDTDLTEYLLHYALDPRRAGWKYLLSLPSDGRMLDFGCGWGGLALSLGVHFKDAWVSDIVPERVAMVLKRSRELGYDHFKGCVSSGWPRLPFEDGYFDLIVLNGALEWIPSSIKGDPQKIQQAFLDEVSRVLSPNGQFVIGIENRFGFSYFTGRREEHTKLKYISLLPRFAGKVYHRLALRSGYRCYTYGKWGLARVLRLAGLPHARFLCPYPDYREFDRVVDLVDSDQVNAAFVPKTRAGKIKAAVVRKTGLMRWMTNSFLVLAGKQAHVESTTFIHRLLRSVFPEEGDRSVVSYRLTPAGNVLVQCGGQADIKDEGDILLTLPLGEKAAIRLQRRIENRTRLRSLLDDGILADWTSGVFENVVYSCEPYFIGVKASALSTSEAVTAGVSMLNKFHSKCQSAMQDFSTENFFTPAVVNRFLDEVFGGNPSDKTEILELLSTPWNVRTGPYHGDFHLGNILKNETSGELRLIDWDLAGTNGLPIWDALNLWVHTRFEDGEKWADCFASACDALADDGGATWLSEYAKQHGFSRDELRVGLLTYPLLQWRNKMEFGDGKGDVIADGLADCLLCVVNKVG